MSYEYLFARFKQMSQDIFGNNLTGIYLHGSYCLGCFNPKKSDLDLLLVIEDNITDEQKMAFMNNVVKMHEEAPAKGIELSVVKREYCKPFVYPTPFELHFSEMHLRWFKDNPEDYVSKMKGTDKDLAAHITIINENAVVLCGTKVKEVFDKVPKSDYVDSIWNDIEDAKARICMEPMYVALTLCRVLGYLIDNLILSKQSGGEWGLKNLPRNYHGFLREALLCYQSDRKMEADMDLANEYAEYMINEIVKRKVILEA